MKNLLLRLQRSFWRFKLEERLSKIIFSYNVRDSKPYKKKMLRYNFCKGLVEQSLENFSANKQTLTSAYKLLKQ